MSVLRPRKTSTTFLLYIIPVMILIAAVQTLIGEYSIYKIKHQELETKLVQLANKYGGLLAEPLWNIDEHKVQQILGAIQLDHDLAGLAVYDRNGSHFGSTGILRDLSEEESRLQLKNAVQDEHASFAHFLSHIANDRRGSVPSLVAGRTALSFQMDVSSQSVGTLYIFLSERNIIQSFFSRLRGEIVKTLITILVLVGIVMTVYSMTTSTPLKQMQKSIRAIRDGQRDVTIEQQGNDEIGQAIEAFNELQLQQYEHQQELAEARDNLEDRVRERTAELHAEIHDRTTAEQELKNLRNYLTSIIDSMPSILIGIDNRGIVTQWNQAAVKATGTGTEEALGKPLTEVFPRTIEFVPLIEQALATQQEQFKARHRYGEHSNDRVEDLTIYPLTNGSNNGAVIRLDDVTERVRIEEMMIQSEKMLSVGGLAAGMAHEINNPLAGIMQTVSVLEQRLKNDSPANERAAQAAGTTLPVIQSYIAAREIPQMLVRIHQSGVRAAEIVSNMLAFSRKDTGVRATHSIEDIIEKCLDLAGNDYDLKKKFDFRKIEIVREYAPDLPLIPCEAGSIQQVILNILRNGAEEMQHNPPERNPKFILRTALEENAMVRVEIEDNGPGMAEDVSRRIFEPFFTTKQVGLGTGLGLSVSYFIIRENHDGNMQVRTHPGQGANFIFRLPGYQKSASRSNRKLTATPENVSGPELRP